MVVFDTCDDSVVFIFKLRNAAAVVGVPLLSGLIQLTNLVLVGVLKGIHLPSKSVSLCFHRLGVALLEFTQCLVVALLQALHMLPV